MIQLLFHGVGWTDIALALNRVAVGMFFMFSGYHKLFNAARHRAFTDELRSLRVPAVRINQWRVPFVEFSASDTDLAGAGDFSAADGDVVYVSFASPAAKDRAPSVLDSNAWRRLSATRDNRVFIVNNEVWQTGQGVVAARGILDDLRLLNAPIN